MSNSDPVEIVDPDSTVAKTTTTTPFSSSSLPLPLSLSLGGLSATATEEDGGDVGGFVTPTGTADSIPEAVRCPAAPRKSAEEVQRRIKRRLKRKRLPERQTPVVLLDLATDVDSMFPPILRPNLTSKIKKARTL